MSNDFGGQPHKAFFARAFVAPTIAGLIIRGAIACDSR